MQRLSRSIAALAFGISLLSFGPSLAGALRVELQATTSSEEIISGFEKTRQCAAVKKRLAVAFLVDESRSIRTADSGDRRVGAISRAVDRLNYSLLAVSGDNQPKVDVLVAVFGTKFEVLGKQWSWDFNYTDSNVHEVGIQSQFAGQLGSEAALPTLWLEKDVPVKIALDARDVIHSFWVVDFLYKKDVFPGKTNYIYFTPTKLGTYKGKCAELCGEYHSLMLFNVKVVDGPTYDAHMADLAAAGNTGLIDNKYNRGQNLPGNGN